ncbi:hypothetical protein SMC26_16870 [Actinomadura fulvescens]|uniref:Secreted protein n=1 Tax=Actinomadura fulvescens TaxID=46160 RepID=A0ABP6CHX7_9ACTN
MKRLLMLAATCAAAATAGLAGAGPATADPGVPGWLCKEKGGSVLPVGDDYVCYGGYFNGEPVHKYKDKGWDKKKDKHDD